MPHPTSPSTTAAVPRTTRRAWVVACAAVVAAALLPSSPLARQQPPVRVQFTSRVLLPELALDGAGTVSRTSPVTDLGVALSAIRATWEGALPDGTTLDLAVRTGDDAAWRPLVEDHDANQPRDDDLAAAVAGTGHDHHDGPQYSDMVVARGTTAQLQVTLRSDGPAVAVRDVALLAFSAPGPAVATPGVARAAGGVRVITRAEWGADETLRVYNENHPSAQIKGGIAPSPEVREKLGDEIEITSIVRTNEDGELLTWPIETAKVVKKVVVHHTSSAQPLTPDEAVAYLRSVYFFHAITRGWGDIGYNYVIDPFGNVYEGRTGGRHVVGAHAANYNIGSVGISVMGTYGEADITPESKRSLVALIHQIGVEEGFDPHGSSTFRLRELANVLGHRDVGATACPGDALWASLENIRALAAQETVDPADPRWLPVLLPAKTEHETLDLPQVPDAVSDGDIVNLRMRVDELDAILEEGGVHSVALHALPDNPHYLTLRAGEAAELTYRYVNDGTAPLTDLTYLRADVVPRRLQLGVGDGSIVARLQSDEQVVRGGLASFTFPVAADEAAHGTFELQFTPVINGTRSWPLAASRLTVTIDPGTVVERVKAATVDRSVEVISAFAIAVAERGTPPDDATEAPAGERDATADAAGPADAPAEQVAMAPAAVASLPPASQALPERFRPRIADDLSMLPDLPAEEPIRVHLTRAPSDRLVLRSKQQLSITVDAAPWRSVPAGEDLLATPVGDGVRAVRSREDAVGAVVRVTAAGGAPIEVANWTRDPSESANADDVRFRGTVELRAAGGRFVVINELPVEGYLAGLAEPNPRDPTAKLEAIAIVARSYAQYYRDTGQKFPGEPYQLNDDPNVCQKYLGYGFELRAPAFRAAVDATRGQVVLYEGRPVKTPFFSASLGMTKSASEVWGWTDTPYLVAVADPCDAPRVAGHGVGLSGCGARVLAERGWTAEQILAHFYPGTTLSPRTGS